MLCHLGHGKCLKEREDFLPVFHIPTRQLANYKGMAYDLSIVQKCCQVGIPRSEMGYPNRSIDEDHSYLLAGLLLGMGRSDFSVPPSLASLLLLS